MKPLKGSFASDPVFIFSAFINQTRYFSARTANNSFNRLIFVTLLIFLIFHTNSCLSTILKSSSLNTHTHRTTLDRDKIPLNLPTHLLNLCHQLYIWHWSNADCLKPTLMLTPYSKTKTKQKNNCKNFNTMRLQSSSMFRVLLYLCRMMKCCGNLNQKLWSSPSGGFDWLLVNTFYSSPVFHYLIQLSRSLHCV